MSAAMEGSESIGGGSCNGRAVISPFESATTLAASPTIPRSSSLPPFALELAAGTAGGTAQLCVGHPFDTAKVKLQRGSGKSSAITVVRKTIAREGIVGLYAGIQAPLPFVVLFNATLFTANAGIRSILGRGRPEDALSLTEVGIAGAGAGAAVSLIAGPTELVKCRMQADPNKYNGVFDCTRRVYAAGGVKAFRVGLGATLAREVPGTAIFFGVYEMLTRAMRHARGETKNTVSEQMLAGGLAGVGFWVSCYPIDFCKTMIQTDKISQPRYGGLLDCMRQTVASHGVRGLYRGIGPALARSFPACGVTFLAYEEVKKGLSNR